MRFRFQRGKEGVAMEYYLGGYYLVEGIARPEQFSSFLPDTLWSLSNCMCHIYPNAWALPWVNTSADDLEEMRLRLSLTQAEFVGMQAGVDTAFNEERFGWPHVWLDLASARDFHNRYLSAILQVKLLAIALAETHLENALHDTAPWPGEGEWGVHQMLSRRLMLSQADTEQPVGQPRGFEVLGADHGGGFHSFLCNYLEKPYRETLGLSFNEHGLLTNKAEAGRAADFTNLETTGAEPVPWYPWLVVEYPLGVPVHADDAAASQSR
jgi:hypothetical protein